MSEQDKIFGSRTLFRGADFPCKLLAALTPARFATHFAETTGAPTANAEFPHIAIIGAPKTGSTFLFQTLALLTRFEPISVLQTANGRVVASEADLGRADFIASSGKSFIIREHLPPNQNTLTLLERAKLRPIILVRNLNDTIVSLAEEWARQWRTVAHIVEVDGFHLQFCGAIPWTFIQRFLKASPSERFDRVIEVALPWLCAFASGWSLISARRPSFARIIGYDVIAADPHTVVRTICHDLGLSAIGDINDAVEAVLSDRQRSNFNVGRSGRGRELLSVRQREQVASTWRAFADDQVAMSLVS